MRKEQSLLQTGIGQLSERVVAAIKGRIMPAIVSTTYAARQSGSTIGGADKIISATAGDNYGQGELATQACKIDGTKSIFPFTKNNIDAIEKIWLQEETFGGVINADTWSDYLAGVRSEVNAKSKWNFFAPLGYDTTLPGVGCLDNRNEWYYVAPLGRFAKGTDINYVGQGMYYNWLHIWSKADVWVAPFLWKGSHTLTQKMFGTRGYGNREPYSLPSSNTYFFARYGFEHYGQ